MSLQILFNTLVASAHCALVAVGFTLIYRSAKFFHFAHAAVYTVAAYVGYVFSALIGLNIYIAIIAAMAAAACLGAAIDLWIYRPLRSAGASAVGLLAASLGVLIAVNNAVSLVFGDDTKKLLPPDSITAFEVLGVRISSTRLLLIILTLLAWALVYLLLHATRIGIVLRAVASDNDLAITCGVDTKMASVLSFVLGSALAGLAGVMWVATTAVHPGAGFSALLTGVTAAVVGGGRSLRGAVAGSVFVSAAQQVASWKFSAEWQDPVVFGVLLAYLIVKPRSAELGIWKARAI